MARIRISGGRQTSQRSMMVSTSVVCLVSLVLLALLLASNIDLVDAGRRGGGGGWGSSRGGRYVILNNINPNYLNTY